MGSAKERGAEADTSTAAAEVQKGAAETKAVGAARAEEAKAAAAARAEDGKTSAKATAVKKAREVKGKAKGQADAKAGKAGVFRPGAEGVVKKSDDKAEKALDTVAK